MFKSLFTIISNPRLTIAAYTSKKAMARYKRNAFESSTLKELMTDTFTYKGTKQNRFYAKDRVSGSPIPIDYEISTSTKNNVKAKTAVTDVDFDFFFNGNKVGEKNFSIVTLPNSDKQILSGYMQNYSDDIIGLGIRGDQMQIEYALQNGINQIPIYASDMATLFHAKMGFLPTENLHLVKSYKDALEKFEKLFKNYRDIYGTDKNFKPIITRINNEFFFDENKTIANMNLVRTTKDMKSTKNYEKVPWGRGLSSKMELSGKELGQWKILIQDRKILKETDK